MFSDSERLYTEAFSKVCAKYDKTFTWEIKSTLLGFQGHECAEKIIKALNIPITVEEFMSDCQKANQEVFTNVQLMPGDRFVIFWNKCFTLLYARYRIFRLKKTFKWNLLCSIFSGAQKLVEHLHKNGVHIALATSSSQESVNLKMKDHTDFLKKFHHLTMGSSDPEVTKGKPDPAIFLVCASRFPDKPKAENVSEIIEKYYF